MTAYARTSDPWTSHVAALSVATQPLKNRVMHIFEKHGFPLTDEQLILEYRNRVKNLRWPQASDSGIRSRRSELVADGYVIDTGRVEKTVSGRSTILWGLPWVLN